MLTELVTLITGDDDANGATVHESLDINDLAELDAEGQLPAYGVIYRGYQEVLEKTLGNRKYYAVTHWDLAGACRDEGSGGAARRAALRRLTLARDRVHFQQSAADPKSRFIAIGEEIQKLDQERVGFVLTVKLKLALGT